MRCGLPKTKRGLLAELRDLEGRLQSLGGVEGLDAMRRRGEDLSLIRKRGETLFELGEVLFRLARFDEASVRFGQATVVLWLSPSLHDVALASLVRRMTALTMLGRLDEALDIVEKFIKRWPRIELPAYPDLVPDVYLSRVTLLDQLGRGKDEVDAAAVAVIARADAAKTAHQRWIVTYSWQIRGRIAQSRGEAEAALAAYDVAAELAAGGDSESVRELLPAVMAERAAVLEASGQLAEARAAYGAIVARFQRSSRPNARRAVAEASARAAALARGTELAGGRFVIRRVARRRR